ncbi:hypothetical protein [Rhizobium sp. FKL33]|uniref:hypothetical protein n=1 Tax=Rhizobium sp. FKL33 TaxID=2562307 RepID=UPI0014854279|nr:hypothetical protein [Rhizobium sp. FKL33]
MNAIMMRRFAIICLGAALFALGLQIVVEHHSRAPHLAQFGGHACSNPLNPSCGIR